MSKSRAYCFTINNYTDEDIANLGLLGYQYLIYGREVGESGTKHLQGYMYFKSQRLFTAIKKKLPTAHIEARKGSHKQAREYCMKEGDYVEDGEPPEKSGGNTIAERIRINKRIRESDLNTLVDEGIIHITQVRSIKNAKLDLAQEAVPYTAEGTRGTWLWGPPGTGKTHYARTEFSSIFYIKPQNKWFDGYTGQKVIVLDDLDKGGTCLGHYLKIWADKWACTGEVKGGTVNLQHEHFVVTSNYSIEELWFEDEEMVSAIRRRFKVKHFTNLQ